MFGQNQKASVMKDMDLSQPDGREVVKVASTLVATGP